MIENDFKTNEQSLSQSNSDYDNILKKFEEPTEYKKHKKKHKALGLIFGLLGVVLLSGAIVTMLLIPNSNSDETVVEKALLTTKTDNNVLQVEPETTKKGEIKQNGTGFLMEYLPEKIKSIKINNISGTYSVNSYTSKKKTDKTDSDTKEDSSSATKYTLVGFEEFDLQSGRPDDLAEDSSSIEFSQIIEADATNNLSDYGLDKPVATATVTYRDGKKAIITVGNNALQGAGTYISFGNSSAVYLVKSEEVDTFLMGINDLISLTINNTATDTESTNFEYVRLTGKAYNDEEIIFSINEDTNSITSSYLITSPEKAFADDNEASSISGGIRGLLATDVVHVNPTAKEINSCGLSDNYSHLVAKYPDTTINLLASKPDNEGNCYLMKNGGNIIYKINCATIPWVKTNTDKLTSRYVLNANLQGLTSLVVETDKTTKFMLNTKTTQTTNDEGTTTDSTTTTVHHGAKELTLSYFETYFNNISLLTKCDNDKETPTKKSDLTVTYSYSNARAVDVVRFYKGSTGKHIVTINSRPVGHVYSSYVTKLKEQTVQITNDNQVTSFK